MLEGRALTNLAELKGKSPEELKEMLQQGELKPLIDQAVRNVMDQDFAVKNPGFLPKDESSQNEESSVQLLKLYIDNGKRDWIAPLFTDAHPATLERLGLTTADVGWVGFVFG